MTFDPNNNIVKLCAEGMELEGLGKSAEAHQYFQDAWNKATDDFEKFIAAHYLARHQQSITDKLHWDQIALQHALQVKDETTKGALPSLYLNIGKCYEDLNDLANAKTSYEMALFYAAHLPDDCYGTMIRNGITQGFARMNIS